ncbi:hypothetical protein [Roseofilum capinflatum]|uniref:Putative antitoxin VapB45-like DNA-binding HTH domain-containing protein n=1 Tax=Roseofilum capinflatum BLCC-M114 TaxID=3022440 RepID=A0ABT7B7Y5_9CYAN|nr:hypothetical protein [Roseofilum capinflatum]MDJ1175278.1 hypothetical protein [Roseofilum capinflatum BLCC-M114]
MTLNSQPLPKIDIYGGKDPRNIPNYSIGDAARYLKIPSSTIRSWVAAYTYKVKKAVLEGRGFKPNFSW